MDTSRLSDALRHIAIDGWEQKKQPVFLSHLPKKLAEILGADYKTFLGDVSLKKFIAQSDSSLGYQLAQHPTQMAKVGILPWGVPYEFPLEPGAEPAPEGISAQDIVGFARILRSMTPDELVRTSLPASLVVRLLGDK